MPFSGIRRCTWTSLTGCLIRRVFIDLWVGYIPKGKPSIERWLWPSYSGLVLNFIHLVIYILKALPSFKETASTKTDYYSYFPSCTSWSYYWGFWPRAMQFWSIKTSLETRIGFWKSLSICMLVHEHINWIAFVNYMSSKRYVSPKRYGLRENVYYRAG